MTKVERCMAYPLLAATFSIFCRLLFLAATEPSPHLRPSGLVRSAPFHQRCVPWQVVGPGHLDDLEVCPLSGYDRDEAEREAPWD